MFGKLFSKLYEKPKEWINLPVEVKSVNKPPEGFEDLEDTLIDPPKTSKGVIAIRTSWVADVLGIEGEKHCFVTYEGNTFKVLMTVEEVTKILESK